MGSMRAGTVAEVFDSKDVDWLIVDVGFSNTMASCGVLEVKAGETGTAVPKTFAETRALLTGSVKKHPRPLHLVLEAPLSAWFTPDGNPQPRFGEKRNPPMQVDKSDSAKKKRSNERYWYVGAGAAVKVGALFLLRAIAAETLARDVVVFEGFVSFKDQKTSHIEDVSELYAAVKARKAALSESLSGTGYGVSLLSFVGGTAEPLPPIIGLTPRAKSGKS